MTYVIKAQNQYVISYQQNNKERKLIVQANFKMKNRKELWLKALVDSGCTYMGIDKQLVKEEKIKTKPLDVFFEVFNADGTKKRRSNKNSTTGDRN